MHPTMESGHPNQLPRHSAVRSDNDIHLRGLCSCDLRTAQVAYPPSKTVPSSRVNNSAAPFPGASSGCPHLAWNVTDGLTSCSSSTLLPRDDGSPLPSHQFPCGCPSPNNGSRAHGGGPLNDDHCLGRDSSPQVGDIASDDGASHQGCVSHSGSALQVDSVLHCFFSHSDSSIGSGSATGSGTVTQCGRVSQHCSGTHVACASRGSIAPCAASLSHVGGALQSGNATHGVAALPISGHSLCGNILYSDYDRGIPGNDHSSRSYYPCSDGSHDSGSDKLPLLKAQSDTDAVAPRLHQQAVPKSFSWVLCGRVMKDFLGAQIHAGEELSPRLLTRDKDPAADSMSSASEGPICRICHEGDGEGKLVQPCQCCGTLRYTHRRCLETWLQTKNDDICELCRYHFQTQRRDRPFKQWLQRPARPQDRRNVLLDILCFCLLTPMVFTSAWLCIHGAFYYLSYFNDRGLQALGLIVLATVLIVIFLFWSVVSLRYHCIIWNIWRRENQTVHIVVPDRAPSVIRRDESRNNSCSVVIPERKVDINGNFLWLHKLPDDAIYV